MQKAPRENWNTKIGFVFAAVGSAVGLGNIWRFPYLTAEYGGAAFVLVYIVLLILIGMPVMTAEFILGRGSGKSPVQALIQPGENNWSGLGYLFVITGLGILSYYSVIAGWTLRYSFESLSGVLLAVDPGDHFDQITTGTTSLMYHIFFMLLTTGIVLGGVRKGIEQSVKVLIPLLIALIAGLGIWASFQIGAVDGYRYYLQPDFSELISNYALYLPGIGHFSISFLSLGLLAGAAGQTFFTLSLGMGAMITYASYLPRKDDLIEKTFYVSFADFGIAFLSGLMIFPIIFSFGLIDRVGESPLGALFIAIPEAFQQVTTPIISQGLSFIFFFALLLAALTSAVSLLEVVTSSLMDELKMNRRVAAVSGGLACLVVGIPAAFSLDWLGMADKIAGSFLLLVGGLALAIYVGWIMKEPTVELSRGLKLKMFVKPWRFLLRYLAPLALLAILSNFVLNFIQELF